MDFLTLTPDQLGSLNAGSLAALPIEDTSSSSSASSDSSESSASTNSSSSPSSQSSASSASSESSSSSSSEEETKPRMNSNSFHNRYPSILINDDDPGRVSEIDQITFKHAEVLVLRGPVVVDIESWYSNSEIRYRLGGKNPTNKSLLYTGPLVFRENLSGTDNTVIKARLYDRSNSNLKSKIIRLEFRILPVI